MITVLNSKVEQYRLATLWSDVKEKGISNKEVGCLNELLVHTKVPQAPPTTAVSGGSKYITLSICYDLIRRSMIMVARESKLC